MPSAEVLIGSTVSDLISTFNAGYLLGGGGIGLGFIKDDRGRIPALRKRAKEPQVIDLDSFGSLGCREEKSNRRKVGEFSWPLRCLSEATRLRKIIEVYLTA